jgi:lipoprotein-releasing system ATP-binding protein
MIAELINICKVYEKPGTTIHNQVLDNISLSVQANESLAITGPSGSGKSTLLNILGTLDRPNSGIVRLNGITIGNQDATFFSEMRNTYLGFVFQQHHLLPQLSVLENVLLPTLVLKDSSARKAAGKLALSLIERVGLQNHMHHKPSQMSVGECQRVAVVRALINQPKLLLADEPTGSLDPESADQLSRLLADLKKDQQFSMVVVTHSMELASRMDKIYKLASGKLIPGITV